MATRDKLEFVDATTLTLVQWIGYLEGPENNRPAHFESYRFPTDRHFDEFIQTIKDRSERQVKLLLRNFLIMGGSLGIDRHNLRSLLLRDDLKEVLDKYEYAKRLINQKRDTWEGMSWIIDLIPTFPSQAIAAIEAYDLAHYFMLPDGRIHSLSDSVAIIRAKYLTMVTQENLADSLTPREFEFLVAANYIKLGYDVQVTQQTRDGGYDIIAVKDLPNSTERLLIECKSRHSPVPIVSVRSLMGVLGVYAATKGVLVSTAGFTAPTIAFAKETARLELVNHVELCQRFNVAFGHNWASRVSELIISAQVQLAKARVK